MTTMPMATDCPDFSLPVSLGRGRGRPRKYVRDRTGENDRRDREYKRRAMRNGSSSIDKVPMREGVSNHRQGIIALEENHHRARMARIEAAIAANFEKHGLHRRTAKEAANAAARAYAAEQREREAAAKAAVAAKEVAE